MLLAESRASKRVMTLGARTVPMSHGAANKWVPCNPNTRMLRRRLVASRRQAFKDWGSRDPFHARTVCFRRTAQRTVRTHSVPAWYPSAPVSCFLCGRAARKVSREMERIAFVCGPVSGYKLRRSCRCRRPRRPPRFFQRFRFAFPAGSREVSLRASRDRSSVKGGASNSLLGTR